MIVDVRCYTIQPRKMKTYLKIFEDHGLPVQQRNGLKLLGYFVHTVGSLNKVTHFWEFDSLADMEQKRSARDADPGWAAYQEKTDGLVQAQENSLTTPAPFSPIK
jgi:hypothetical protein